MSALGIGVQLTIFGMGLVFLLLAIMALLIKLLLRSDSMQPEPSEAEEEEKIAPAPLAAGLDADSMAAIIIAVTRHCTVCRKEAAPVMRQHQPGTLPSRWVSVGRSLQNVSWQPGRRR